jgi:hypothetical protein
MTQVKVAAALACLSVFTLNTQAGIIVDISNAIAGTSQDYKNTPNHIIGKQAGYFGANIFTDDTESTAITVEFLGSQAKWDVFFTLSNGEDAWTIKNHPNGPSGLVKANNTNRQQGTINVAGNQLLNFSFAIDDQWKGKGVDWTVNNGSNGLPGTLQGTGRYFWTGFEYNQAGGISAIILGLDDGGGLYDEDNDDLMIRMSGFGSASLFSGSVPNPPQSTPVPVPASLWLMLSSMGILGAIKRRQLV